MINNLQVLENIEDYIDQDIRIIEEIKEKQNNKDKKRLALQKKTIWGDLVNPKVSICKFLDKAESITSGTVGAVVAMALGYVGFLYVPIWVVARVSNNLDLMNRTANSIFSFCKYAAPILKVSSPFIGTYMLRSKIKNDLSQEEFRIQKEKKELQKEKENLKNILRTIEYVKMNPEKTTILSDVLKYVDLSINGTGFNKEFIKLLAVATSNPTKGNFGEVSKYITDTYNNVSTDDYYNAADEFYDNELIYKIEKSY